MVFPISSKQNGQNNMCSNLVLCYLLCTFPQMQRYLGKYSTHWPSSWHQNGRCIGFQYFYHNHFPVKMRYRLSTCCIQLYWNKKKCKTLIIKYFNTQHVCCFPRFFQTCDFWSNKISYNMVGHLRIRIRKVLMHP